MQLESSYIYDFYLNIDWVDISLQARDIKI